MPDCGGIIFNSSSAPHPPCDTWTINDAWVSLHQPPVVRPIFVSDVESLGCQDNFLKRDGAGRVNVLVIIPLMARIWVSVIQSGGIKPHHSSIISITRCLIYISIESHQINDTHTIDRIKIAGGELFHFQSTDKESNDNVIYSENVRF